MSKFSAWVTAARIRTLPLSVSGILMGTALAGSWGYFDDLLLILALLTTVSLQITSNFANDYGDGVKGTDNDERIGPRRTLQAGLLTRGELKQGILISILASAFLITLLVYTAFDKYMFGYALLFGILGVACIWAAIKYTVGSSAYGYIGLGDLFVFSFFGLLSVLGSFFLYAHFIWLPALLPAASIGLLSTGVLNLNNLRDMESDRKAGKRTLVVRMGWKRAKIYQQALLITAFLCMLIFVLWKFPAWKFSLCLLAFLPVFLHMRRVYLTAEAALLDAELKKLALSAFLLGLLCFLLFNNFL